MLLREFGLENLGTLRIQIDLACGTAKIFADDEFVREGVHVHVAFSATYPA